MQFAQVIATLRTELKNKNEELAAVIVERDANAGAAAQVITLTEQNGALTAQVTALGEQVTTLTTENTTLKEKVTSLEGNIEGQVVDRIASAGVPPIAKPGTAEDGTKTATISSGLTGLARAIAAHQSQA